MLNYGITQNDQINLDEIDGEEFKVDLSLYQALGDASYRVGDEVEAVKWYTRGLKLAQEAKEEAKIKLFSNLIFVSL